MRPNLLKLFGPLMAIALTASAQAAITFFAPAGGIPIPTDFAGVSVDLETGATSSALDGLPDGDANFYFGGAELSNDADMTAASPSWQPVRTSPGNTAAAANLTVGTTVDGSSIYGTGFGSSGDISSHFPPFNAGSQGYIGFSLLPNAGGSELYGWMLVTLEDDGVTPGLIHSWAFETDPGTAILVGAIPEPGSALLSLLGLSLVAIRRRR